MRRPVHEKLLDLVISNRIFMHGTALMPHHIVIKQIWGSQHVDSSSLVFCQARDSATKLRYADAVLCDLSTKCKSGKSYLSDRYIIQSREFINGQIEAVLRIGDTASRGGAGRAVVLTRTRCLWRIGTRQLASNPLEGKMHDTLEMKVAEESAAQGPAW